MMTNMNAFTNRSMRNNPGNPVGFFHLPVESQRSITVLISSSKPKPALARPINFVPEVWFFSWHISIIHMSLSIVNQSSCALASSG